jgi:transposase
MDQWSVIRKRVLVEGESKRQILRETRMHWTTLEKILAHSSPPGYQMVQSRARPKLGSHVEWIQDVLAADKEVPRKQRHTAKRIYDRLVAERGYSGKYTVVKDLVAEIKRTRQEIFMPLTHRPGEAQVDFFEALARINGVLRKVHVFVMALAYSDMFFLKAFERECTEAFWEGHIRAFQFFGGVPGRITYDNMKIAVRMIVGAHERELTAGFLQLVSHYLFDHHFCTVRRANEKGVVEGTGKYARCNFMVPVPQVSGLEELNQQLLEHCWNEQFRRLRGKGKEKRELWREEELRSLPAAPFDGCLKQPGHANSLSLVRFDDNDYSVPVAYAHHALVVKGYFDRVVICARMGETIAEHRRSWEREQTMYEPVHYLPLLERKPGALDHSAALSGMVLPDCFREIRRRLEDQAGRDGTLDYIRVLRLLEKYPVHRVAAAIGKSLTINALDPGVVAMYCLPEETPEVWTFRLEGREHLRGVTIAAPEISGYQELLLEVRS